MQRLVVFCKAEGRTLPHTALTARHGLVVLVYLYACTAGGDICTLQEIVCACRCTVVYYYSTLQHLAPQAPGPGTARASEKAEQPFTHAFPVIPRPLRTLRVMYVLQAQLTSVLLARCAGCRPVMVGRALMRGF